MSYLSRLLSWWWPRPLTAATLAARIDAEIDAASEDDAPVVGPRPARQPDAGGPGFVPAPSPPGLIVRTARALQMAMDSFTNPLSGIGSAGDKGTAAVVNLSRLSLSQVEIDALYRRNGYARRIIDLVPDLATRKAGSFTSGDDGDSQDPLAEDLKRLGAWNAIAEGWRLGRRDGSALTLMVLDEDVPPEYRGQPARWLSTPLDLSRVRSVVALVTFEREEFDAAEWETDLRSGRFRAVKTWQITPYAVGATVLNGSAPVHASRCLYWDGAYVSPRRRIEQNGHGDSILEAIYDQVRNKTVSDQALATLLNELKINVLKLKGLAGHQVSDQEEAFRSKMSTLNKSRSSLNIMLLDEGEEFSTQAQTVAGYGDLDARSAAALSSVAGVPQTVLFGDSPGGLNADGESSALNLRMLVSAAAEWVAGPNVQRLGEVLFAAKEGPTGGKIPEGWGFEWAPLDEPTKKGTAELRKLHAERDAIYLQWGVLSPEQVASSRFGPDGYSDEIGPIDEGEPNDRAAIAEALAEQTRADAASRRRGVQHDDADLSGLWLGLPLDAASVAKWESARSEAGVLLPGLQPYAGPAHMTLVYFGEVPREHVPAVVSAVAAVLESVAVATPVLTASGLDTFPVGPAGTPVVVSFGWSDVWAGIRDAVIDALRSSDPGGLANLSPWPLRPHATVGYVPREIGWDEVAPLWRAPSGSGWPVTFTGLELRHGSRLVASWPLPE